MRLEVKRVKSRNEVFKIGLGELRKLQEGRESDRAGRSECESSRHYQGWSDGYIISSDGRKYSKMQ